MAMKSDDKISIEFTREEFEIVCDLVGGTSGTLTDQLYDDLDNIYLDTYGGYHHHTRKYAYKNGTPELIKLPCSDK